MPLQENNNARQKIRAGKETGHAVGERLLVAEAVEELFCGPLWARLIHVVRLRRKDDSRDPGL